MRKNTRYKRVTTETGTTKLGTGNHFFKLKTHFSKNENIGNVPVPNIGHRRYLMSVRLYSNCGWEDPNMLNISEENSL